MELKFTASKKELLKTLKVIKTGLPKGKHGTVVNLELQIGINKVVMSLPGVSYELYGKTSGLGKAFLPLLHFESMVRDSSLEDVTVQIEDGKAIVGKYTSASPRITTYHVENVNTIELAVNHTILDLLALRNKYTEAELTASNYDKLILTAERKMEESIYKALEYLKAYGLTYEILHSFILKKIKNI